MASTLSINGRQVGGEIYTLKAGKKVEDAIATSKKDGLEEVFFKAKGQDYIAVAPSLNINDDTQISIRNQKRFKPQGVLTLDGQAVSVQLIASDRENRGDFIGFKEGVNGWKMSGLARIGLGASWIAGGSIGVYKSGAWAVSSAANFSVGGALNIAKGVGKAIGGSGSALLMGAGAVAGAALIYNGISEYNKASKFHAAEQARLDNMVKTSPIQEYLGEKVD